MQSCKRLRSVHWFVCVCVFVFPVAVAPAPKASLSTPLPAIGKSPELTDLSQLPSLIQQSKGAGPLVSVMRVCVCKCVECAVVFAVNKAKAEEAFAATREARADLEAVRALLTLFGFMCVNLCVCV